jgi:putative PIN family toxin of toxin-antitoxin system
MNAENVFVFDTNAIISAYLAQGSTSNKAFRAAISVGIISLSNQLFTEIVEVIYRPKFDRYFPTEDSRDIILQRITNFSREFSIIKKIEVAIASHADAVISGDIQLFSLHPFRGIPTVTASDFFKMFEEKWKP